MPPVINVEATGSGAFAAFAKSNGSITLAMRIRKSVINLTAPDGYAVYVGHDDSEGSENSSVNFLKSTVNATGVTQSFGTISLSDSIYNLEGASTFTTVRFAGSNGMIVVNALSASDAATYGAAQKGVAIGQNDAEGVVVAMGGALNDQFANPSDAAAALLSAVGRFRQRRHDGGHRRRHLRRLAG